MCGLPPPPRQDSGLACLSSLSALTALKLRGCWKVCRSIWGFVHSPPKPVPQARHLGLQLYGRHKLVFVFNMERFDLTYAVVLGPCRQISGEGLAALHPPFVALQRLDLSDCRVTDEGLAQVNRTSIQGHSSSGH